MACIRSNETGTAKEPFCVKHANAHVGKFITALAKSWNLSLGPLWQVPTAAYGW